ncbi:MAG: alcohol dehydrogenase catalytic domain-containing protein [Planctomycetes bacterium]|nr:alcohol dehydrogenase catalytic domain-containing protein [Planctomycetota bacterium]
MKALQYRKSIPRYSLLKLLGPRFRSIYTSGVSPVTLRNLPEPKLPTPQWVRIAPRLAGICGSDLATLCAKGSAYLAPVTSMPFVMGHEVVGTIVEKGSAVRGIDVGERVVIHPALGCKVRGIDPPCDACAAHHDALCTNVTRGDISAGIQTGYCRDTGGGFSESLVVHESQVYPVPDELCDPSAALIEPFACAMHAALRVVVPNNQTVLVIGCGAIGLLTVAALRAVGCRARIVAVAKYDHQRDHALRPGADKVLATRDSLTSRHRQWSAELNTEILDPELGRPTVLGGADVVFDCVASSQSIDDGLRFTTGGGSFVLVGMPGIPKGVDWTPLWYKEITIHAAYAYGPERRGPGGSSDRPRDTFEIAIEAMKTCGESLAELVGEPFELQDHRAAFRSALNTGRSGTVKTVFKIQEA